MIEKRNNLQARFDTVSILLYSVKAINDKAVIFWLDLYHLQTKICTREMKQNVILMRKGKILCWKFML